MASGTGCAACAFPVFFVTLVADPHRDNARGPALFACDLWPNSPSFLRRVVDAVLLVALRASDGPGEDPPCGWFSFVTCVGFGVSCFFFFTLCFSGLFLGAVALEPDLLAGGAQPFVGPVSCGFLVLLCALSAVEAVF